MTVTIRHGDCREVLKTMPDKSVHCCVTSPPYFGLRDYGHAGQIGLEATPDAFVAEMVAVFRDVRRVLRDDGTLWLNLGDSYSSGGRGGGSDGSKQTTNVGALLGAKKAPDGFKAKDLLGIPWRVAFALQADGWYLRQDIIWSKPNPMPESVTDRCTKAHEYIFLMSKSARYFYDADAIAEAVTASTIERLSQPNLDNQIGSERVPGKTNGNMKAVIKKSGDYGNGAGRNDGDRPPSGGWTGAETRNRRSVWTVTTQPFSEAHFATFPPDLIEPCIKAGCPSKCCAQCGAPWMRQTEYGRVLSTGGSDSGMRAQNMTAYDPSGKHTIESAYNTGRMVQREKITTGSAPSCSCDAGTFRGVVLDPFGGAGTTGLVADRIGRDAFLIELNPEYAHMAQRRIEGDAGMFAEVLAVTVWPGGQ